MHRKIGAALAGLAVGLVGAVALATPAQADHNEVDWKRERSGDCGQQTFTTTWVEADHRVDNTVLVVQIVGTDEQHVVEIGDDLTVGPFTDEQVTIRWRIWGGGERNHDDPPLDNPDALVEYLDGGGSELDADPPGVKWRNRTVNGCVPPIDPTDYNCDDYDEIKAAVDENGIDNVVAFLNGINDYEPKLTAEHLEGFLDECAPPGKTDPTGEPTETESPAPGKGGGDDDDKPGLPVTGAALPILGGVGAGAAALGTVLFLIGRKRRSQFTAE